MDTGKETVIINNPLSLSALGAGRAQWGWVSNHELHFQARCRSITQKTKSFFLDDLQVLKFLSTYFIFGKTLQKKKAESPFYSSPP